MPSACPNGTLPRAISDSRFSNYWERVLNIRTIKAEDQYLILLVEGDQQSGLIFDTPPFYYQVSSFDKENGKSSCIEI